VTILTGLSSVLQIGCVKVLPLIVSATGEDAGQLLPMHEKKRHEKRMEEIDAVYSIKGHRA
jgi:hypothetical protein